MCELNPAAEYVRLSHRISLAIRPEHIDWVIQTALQIQDGDIFYNVISREVMEDASRDRIAHISRCKIWMSAAGI